MNVRYVVYNANAALEAGGATPADSSADKKNAAPPYIRITVLLIIRLLGLSKQMNAGRMHNIMSK